MPKRKRTDDEGAYKRSRSGGSRIEKRLQADVSSGHKQLQRAFKLAKGFERQKLGRRRKTAAQGEDQDQTARIDSEAEACKTLEPTLIASTYLLRLVEREKALRSSDALMALCQTDQHLPNDHATTTVAARLYNSKPVKTTVADVLDSIRATLGVNQSVSKLKASKVSKLSATSDLSDPPEEELGEDSEGLSGGSEVFQADKATGDEKLGDREEQLHTADVELGSDDEDGFNELEARMIGSDSDGASSIDFEALKASGEHRREAELSITPSDSEPASDSQDEHASEEEEEEEALPKPKDKSAKSKGDSSFLPSLSMAGYISGSDSDASDIEEVAPPRKNRRGQRARQKIWEAKYGDKARHVKEGARDAGWDPRRGATTAARDAKGAWRPGWARQKEPARGSKHASGGNAVRVAPRGGAAPKDEKPLHPSWAAKIKAKQKKNSETSAFAGTKMTFD